MFFSLPRGNMDDIHILHLPIIIYKTHLLVDFNWQNFEPIHSKFHRNYVQFVSIFLRFFCNLHDCYISVRIGIKMLMHAKRNI